MRRRLILAVTVAVVLGLGGFALAGGFSSGPRPEIYAPPGKLVNVNDDGNGVVTTRILCRANSAGVRYLRRFGEHHRITAADIIAACRKYPSG